MPLDGHSYLVSQGWSGKGKGLRSGAIIRPLAIPQKKNLSGLGKDRDEAFPFWDHLFAAAAKSITIKVMSEGNEEDGGDDNSGSSAPTLNRTSTGIISNKRPVSGNPASHTLTTTSDAEASSSVHHVTTRLSLLAEAKRNAAKANLYARFFRGPILGPDNDGNGDTVKKQKSQLNETDMPLVIEPIKVNGVQSLAKVEKKKRERNAQALHQNEDDSDRKERKRRKRDKERNEAQDLAGDNPSENLLQLSGKESSIDAPKRKEQKARSEVGKSKSSTGEKKRKSKAQTSDEKKRKREKKHRASERHTQGEDLDGSHRSAATMTVEPEAKGIDQPLHQMPTQVPMVLDTAKISKKKKKRKMADNSTA